jgi:GT2 family glycosyltransferase
MRLSIIIATWNRREHVIRCVRALAAQRYEPGFEIIVACDRCTDGSVEALRSERISNLQIVVAAAAGKIAALNAALEVASGEIVIFMDDEVEALPGFLEAHARAHRNAAPARVAVTGHVEVELGPDPSPFARRLARDYQVFAESFAHPRATTPLDLNGANCSVPMPALREVGGFDARYKFQRDDFALAVQLIERGYDIRYCREAAGRMHLAVKATNLLERVEERARNDFLLVTEHEWCMPHLPLGRMVTGSAGWELASAVRWNVIGRAAPLIGAARRFAPTSDRLLHWEIEARYVSTLRACGATWRGLRQSWLRTKTRL